MPLRNPLTGRYTDEEMGEMEAIQRFYTQDIHPELHEFLQMKEEDERIPRFGATPVDMERTMFQSRLGTGLLCMEAENVLVNVLQYQTSRLNRGTFSSGYLNDPRNLLCEVLKHFAVETLSHAEVNPDLKDLVEKWSTFIHHLAMAGVFRAGKNAETMEALLISVRNSFRYQIRPSMMKHLSTSSAREHLHWFIQSAKRVLGHGTQFLYFVLRDSENTPKNCTVPNLQIGHMPLARVLRTNSGRLLQAMVLSTPFQKVFPIGYVPGGISKVTEQLLRANTNSLDTDDNGKVLIPRLICQIVRQDHLDRFQKKKQNIQLPPFREDPAFFLKGPLSGIAYPFWEKPILLEEFVKLHELFIRVAALIQLLEQAYSLAGDGGDLLVYGVTRKHVAGLVVDYTLLSNAIRDSIQVIEQHADGLYQHLVRQKPKDNNPVLKWKLNYMQVSSIAMLLSDDLNKCHEAAYRVREHATSYSLTLQNRIDNLKNNLNAFVTDTDEFSKELRNVLQLKGSTAADQLLEAELPRCNQLDSTFGIQFLDLEDYSDTESRVLKAEKRKLVFHKRDGSISDDIDPKTGITVVEEEPTMYISGISPGVHPLTGTQTKVSGSGFKDGVIIKVGNIIIKGAYIQDEGTRKVISFLSPSVSEPCTKTLQVINPDGATYSSPIVYVDLGEA